MRFLNLSSNKSFWKGVDYYHNNKVISVKKIDESHYSGEIASNNDVVYHVNIDIDHPKKSTCDCPFANGRKIICKHMVALYLTIFPEKEKEILDYIEEEKEMYQQDIEDKVVKEKEAIKYVKSLSKEELQDELLNKIFATIDDFYYSNY